MRADCRLVALAADVTRHVMRALNPVAILEAREPRLQRVVQAQRASSEGHKRVTLRGGGRLQVCCLPEPRGLRDTARRMTVLVCGTALRPEQNRLPKCAVCQNDAPPLTPDPDFLDAPLGG